MSYEPTTDDGRHEYPEANGMLKVNGAGPHPANLVSDARRMTGTALADLRPHLSDAYLIKRIAGRNTLVGVIGPSGSGKTWQAADFALHIASGTPWRGHRVARGLVVYVALEGKRSAENRFVASRDRLGFAAGSPLEVTGTPINLRDPADVQMLIVFCRECESKHGESVAAIFIDTLARAMAGGDENGPEDMGALIAGADAVRLATGATVFLIHHMGKDMERGGRGHSSLKGALDTELEVTKSADSKLHTMRVSKQRDLPGEGDQFAYTLEVVELGQDDDGEPVTTCIVRPADVPVVERKGLTGKNQAKLLAALNEWRRTNPAPAILSSIELRDIAKAAGLGRARLAEVTPVLQTCGYLTPAVGGFVFHGDSEL